MSKPTIVFLFSIVLMSVIVKVEERNSYIQLLEAQQNLPVFNEFKKDAKL